MDLIPLDPDTLHKLLLSAGVVVALAVVSWAARRALALLPDSGRMASVRFWTQQAVSLVAASAGALFLYGAWVGRRITDNWLEMTVRFVVRETEVRQVKDAIARELLRGLDQAGIGIASATTEIVGVPPLQAHVDARLAPAGQ